MQFTPDFIDYLQPDDIFVFGSNLAGSHIGGAARIARKKFGAIPGVGVGLQGRSYAIPTMQGGVETIKPYVDQFVQLARMLPSKRFLVTRIGCGIAGFTDADIAPLFAEQYLLQSPDYKHELHYFCLPGHLTINLHRLSFSFDTQFSKSAAVKLFVPPALHLFPIFLSLPSMTVQNKFHTSLPNL